MKFLRLLTFLLAGLLSARSHADTLVLVQGYLGNAGSWRASGITAVLQKNGWFDAGHLAATPLGVVEWKRSRGEHDRFYTIMLPTEAPVDVQAGFLATYLRRITGKYGDEAIILVGHSAGGVVARTAMVSYPDVKVSTLVTIASPNHGTQLAERGLSVSNSPVGFFAPVFGAATLNRSRALYANLVRERPGSFLNWLNTRKHPKARYVAVVRALPSGIYGDDVVPGWSQELRGIYGLRGHNVSTFISPGAHGLSIIDGMTIMRIIGTRAVSGH